MPRCPDCNKFVPLDTDDDPEVESLEVDDSGTVEMEARIVNKCAECGTELTEASLSESRELNEEYLAHLTAAGVDTDAKDFDYPVPGHELSVEEGDLSRDQEGGGRYAKSYYTATVGFTLKCECGWTHDDEVTGKVAASHMDSLV